MENEQNILSKEELQNSITLKKGAKGYLWDIKLYFNDNEVKTIDRIKDIDESLRLKYQE